MKKRHIPIISVLAVITLILMQGCDRPWTGVIRGTISDSDTELPIPGVLVKATSLKNSYAVSGLTDEEGRYRLSDVRWGPNLVQIYHPRYSAVEKYTDVIRDDTVELDFEVGQNTLYLDTTLHVTVLNGNGDPVNQAVLDLYELKKSIYDYFFYLETKTTSEDGYLSFTLPRIYEDEIIQMQLRIAAIGYQDQIRDFVISWGIEDPTMTIVMEFVE
ncbi:carboxypeptidase regulatory-like domain-containing protein [bacterium]|nr:carboxypeptidase regulatory-like domain-containing protein [candidate division CSSED10-310 bacterium]